MRVVTPRRSWMFVATVALVCTATGAFAAAPSARQQPAADVDAQVSSTSWNPVVTAPAPVPEPEPEPSRAAPELPSVSNVIMVVNDDGSATLSATFEGRGAPMSLVAVRVEGDGAELPVASTEMWLPVLPGTQTRAGDASDAGGFVVPAGLAADRVAQVTFWFDDATCLSLDAPTVRRGRAHDQVFPTAGDQLGLPAERTAQPCRRARSS